MCKRSRYQRACASAKMAESYIHIHTLKAEEPKNNGNRKHTSDGRCFFIFIGERKNG